VCYLLYIMLFSQLKANRRLEGTCRLHLQGRRTCHFNMRHAAFLLGSLFDIEDVDCMFLRIVGLFSTDYTALYPETQNPSKV
jgi:hypothetical protein